MKIVRCDVQQSAWNSFIAGNANSSVFHLMEWKKIISLAYGHESYYLAAEEKGEIQGLLPLFLIRSRLFGRSLVSLPFTDYGGICTRNNSAIPLLLQEAVRIGQSEKVNYLQLRHRDPLSGVTASGANKVTMLLTLSTDPEILWRTLPSERRNRIKKARRAGVMGRIAGPEGFNQFYSVFAENMRDIGSPVHSATFFSAMLEILGACAKIILVENGKEVIGAAICLFHRDTVYIPWVSSLRRQFALNPNMVLYWTAIDYACRNGYRLLDFGRSSKNSGTYEFKRQWGAQPVDLAWSSFPLNGSAVPTFSGEGLKERVFIECWRRLPLSLTTRLGPLLRGGIPA